MLNYYANFDFYSIEINANPENGGGNTGGISNADGSKIEKGDSLIFDYIDEVEFELEGEASFEVVLVGKEQTNRKPLEPFTMELAPNKEYYFEITGDTIEEADLKRVK